MDSLIYQLDGIVRQPADRAIVSIRTLQIHKGELFCVLGPSGAGKSSLLRLLNFIDAPDEGLLAFEGRHVPYPAEIEMRRRIGTVFQRPEFLSGSVWDNVAYPLRIRRAYDSDVVGNALVHLDIAHLKHEDIRVLSGGEMQRVAIARALVHDPEIILFDEPTANLDPHNGGLVERIIEAEHRRGKTIVLVTHNIFQAQRLAQRVGLMVYGELIELSEAHAFFTNPTDARAKAFVNGEMIY
jgi:tungstate transport system ATP-binding protein